MIIRDMFADDINRKINGVIKVDQDADEVIEQELNEYVITRELKKHFITFFNYYGDAFDQPTADMGVWISGFFGSGKSHFLKMLSYLLENKEVNGIRSVECFRKKFEDDPATFMLIDRATKGPTETILFNIDIEGFSNKDKTAVLRVFAKMFYNHLGFYGENLKVAMMERYIDQQGKTDEFRRVFDEKKGKSWLEMRRAFAFNGKFIIPALMEVLDMSEDDAKAWFNDKTATEISIAQLVEDMKAYVDTKPANFRLLFMIDEVGQYVGTDTNMLLNLQSLTEKIGSECAGKIWVLCTGQEAIDEIIKVRADEFSRIQARFKTRLSLSSSSVDEVIQKRILKKKLEAGTDLENVYEQNDSVLRNLFSFSGSILDIKGYSGPREFSENFPFVPYQFIIMQKVFAEIRKHGNSGKHLSGGERSMLSGFQEAAQKIQEKDEYALVPFFHFYDTLDYLDGSIRRVIERCQKAADNGDGIEQQDVDVLKLLYLVRYIDDIPSNLDNIVILMADDIRVDKIIMREAVRGCLGRLMSQNYIGRTGDTYNFLTDEEQDIQREIRDTNVDTASIVERIAQMIYGNIFTTKKFRYGKYDFPFDQVVDGINVGASIGGMRLRFLTVATDATEKTEFRLMTESKGNEAIVVLADTPYYESLESAMKIRKYVKQRNVSQLPKSVQKIISDQQDEAGKYEQSAMTELQNAIEGAQFYIDGEHLEIKAGNAKSKIDQSLEYLVAHVYSKLDMITENIGSDADIIAILTGTATMLPGMEPNRDAVSAIEEYLEMQDAKKLPTSMADVQSKYSGIPYGWKEIDIAAVVAQLIYAQKVTIKYAGNTIQPDDPKLPDMLRKKSEIGKTSISKRKTISATMMRDAKSMLRDYFDVMDVPDDEDGLIRFVTEEFSEQRNYYVSLDAHYDGHNYPDRALVQESIHLMDDVLSQKKDNIALIERVVKKEDALFDNKEAMSNGIENFFKTQVTVFDQAVQFEKSLRDDLERIAENEEAHKALNTIRLITLVQTGSKFNYNRIRELNPLMDTVRVAHDKMLKEKRAEVLETVRQCMEATHTVASGDPRASHLIEKSDRYFSQCKAKIAELKSLALLDAMFLPMCQYKDNTVSNIEAVLKPSAPKPSVQTAQPGKETAPVKKKVVRAYNRQVVFQAKTLQTDADIDDYVEKIRSQLKQLLKNCDEIRLN